MADMARKERAGEYQIGIYRVTRKGRVWEAYATGPGTMGDGFAGRFLSLNAAHVHLTGESRYD